MRPPRIIQHHIPADQIGTGQNLRSFLDEDIVGPSLFFVFLRVGAARAAALTV